MSQAAHTSSVSSVAMEIDSIPKKRLRSSPTFWVYVAICAGIATAIGWFTYSLRLPEGFRGVVCCDAAEYVRLGSRGVWSAITHVSHRTYGYPLFISLLFAFFGDKQVELMVLLITQLTLHASSVIFLGWTLRRAGFRIYPFIILIVLSTPFLANIAAVALTDSLATSLFTTLIAIQVLLAHQIRFRVSLCCASGLILGFLAAVRPVFVLMFPVFSLAMLISFLRYGVSWGNFKRSSLCILLWGGGLSVCLGGMVWNCYSSFGRYCLIKPSESGHNLAGSFNYAIEHGRFDGVVASGGYFTGWAPTPDRVFTAPCGAMRERPLGSLLDCYERNRDVLVEHFSRRIIGLFDVRAINPYAVSITPVTIAWINRSYGLLAFVGLPAMLLILVAQLLLRRPWEYFVIPMAYVAVQVNFHVENRYIFPVVPICLYIAMAVLFGCVYRRKWSVVVCWIGALALGATFISVVTAWDSVHFPQYKFL